MSLLLEPEVREDYLDAYTLRSWLLTTDHKRIGILYLISITLFFFVGGAAATLMRLELMTPRGDVLSTADAYNRLFTMHGIIMIFFFLIPAIPAVLGNFLIPIMIGSGTGSEVMQRIAAPMIGGMITAPLLSMLIIPAAFLLMRQPRKTVQPQGEV